MAAKGPRENITLECTECKRRNYVTSKNKRNNTEHRLKSNVKFGGVYKMAAKGPRENITLECTECKRRNYVTSKNKRNNTDRLELVKYCKFCKKRTTHKETK